MGVWQVWCGADGGVRGAGVASAAGGEGVVGDVVGGRWWVVVVVVAGLLGGCGVGGWLCVWWRVGALGGGAGVSLRVVLGVVLWSLTSCFHTSWYSMTMATFVQIDQHSSNDPLDFEANF